MEPQAAFDRRITAGVVAMLAAVFACGCGNPSAQQTSAPPPPEVGVVEAKAQAVPLVRDLVGRLSSTRTADVRARAAGIVQKRLYTEGSTVRENQPLFQIDPAPLRAALNAATAALAQAGANATNAHIVAERDRAIPGRKGAPRSYTARRMKARTLLITLALLVSLSVFALNTTSLTITQPWSRATPPGATVGVVYFDILNGGAGDTLLRIESSVAESVEMHSTNVKNGMMEMRPVNAVHVPAHGRVRFTSGGLHVMLVGLRHPLKEGERFPIKLVFRVAGTLEREVSVQNLTATSP